MDGKSGADFNYPTPTWALKSGTTSAAFSGLQEPQHTRVQSCKLKSASQLRVINVLSPKVKCGLLPAQHKSLGPCLHADRSQLFNGRTSSLRLDETSHRSGSDVLLGSRIFLSPKLTSESWGFQARTLHTVV